MTPRAAASRRREALRPDDRLQSSVDFQACYRGRRARGMLLMVVSERNPLGRPRLGLTVSRKVGKAVIRNRVKRWLREAFRRDPRRGRLPSRDYVVHAHPAAADATFREVEQELWKCLEKVSQPPRGRRGKGPQRRAGC